MLRALVRYRAIKRPFIHLRLPEQAAQRSADCKRLDNKQTMEEKQNVIDQ